MPAQYHIPPELLVHYRPAVTRAKRITEYQVHARAYRADGGARAPAAAAIFDKAIAAEREGIDTSAWNLPWSRRLIAEQVKRKQAELERTFGGASGKGMAKGKAITREQALDFIRRVNRDFFSPRWSGDATGDLDYQKIAHIVAMRVDISSTPIKGNRLPPGLEGTFESPSGAALRILPSHAGPRKHSAHRLFVHCPCGAWVEIGHAKQHIQAANHDSGIDYARRSWNFASPQHRAGRAVGATSAKKLPGRRKRAMSKTSKSLLRELSASSPKHRHSPQGMGVRETVVRGVAAALGDALFYTLERVDKRFLDDERERAIYVEALRVAPQLVAAIEKLNGMTIDDFYVFAIDRPGKFETLRQGPFAFGNVLASEALGAHAHVGSRQRLWEDGAPAFPHRLPNARWDRKDKSSGSRGLGGLVSTYTLVLEGVQHFLADGSVVG